MQGLLSKCSSSNGSNKRNYFLKNLNGMKFLKTNYSYDGQTKYHCDQKVGIELLVKPDSNVIFLDDVKEVHPCQLRQMQPMDKRNEFPKKVGRDG